MLVVIVPAYHQNLSVMAPETVLMEVMKIMSTVPATAQAKRNSACLDLRNAFLKSFGVMEIRIVKMDQMKLVVLSKSLVTIPHINVMSPSVWMSLSCVMVGETARMAQMKDCCVRRSSAVTRSRSHVSTSVITHLMVTGAHVHLVNTWTLTTNTAQKTIPALSLVHVHNCARRYPGPSTSAIVIQGMFYNLTSSPVRARTKCIL